jgi:hypothetical protein
VIAWLWLCDGVPLCRSVAQGVRVFEFDFFTTSTSTTTQNTSANMSADNKHLAFTQRVLEKMEATLSVGLLEREAAFAVAERMVALLVCLLFFSCCFVADLVTPVFF